VSKYRVKAIFGPTLQGEGTYAGTPVKFLRLTGCNRWSGLAVDKPSAVCHFCDTDFRGGDVMDAKAIVTALNALGDIRTVVVSGGEPTLQTDHELIAALKAGGYAVHLETNGSNALGDLLPLFDHITMSPKQSRMETRLERCDDLKILWPPIDKQITPETFQGFERKQAWLQPIWMNQERANLDATLIKLMSLGGDWRLSLQTHKIVGVE
jgi:organic radical activating enzyme